jgi:hypothetical protein
VATVFQGTQEELEMMQNQLASAPDVLLAPEDTFLLELSQVKLNKRRRLFRGL